MDWQLAAGAGMTFAVRPIGLVKTGFVFSETVSADVTNYDLRTRAVAAGWDGAAPLAATVTIASGIVVSSNATSTPGFDCGLTAYPAGSSLALANAGYILGMGGAAPTTGAGLPGGTAFRTIASLPVSLNNSGGVIGGGGGGGGSNGSSSFGGGGRTGRTNSAGGPSGNPGTFAKGGNGFGGAGGEGGTTGAGGNYTGDYGSGGGGGWGAAGGAAYGSKAGGAGGAAVVGNSYITWINTGTRYGSIT